MDLIFFHRELNGTFLDKKKVQIVIYSLGLQEFAHVEFLEPRVLRLQDVILNVTCHSLDRLDFLTDFVNHSPIRHWLLPGAYTDGSVTVFRD